MATDVPTQTCTLWSRVRRPTSSWAHKKAQCRRHGEFLELCINKQKKIYGKCGKGYGQGNGNGGSSRCRCRRLVRQLNSWHKERGELLSKAARKNAQVNNNNQHWGCSSTHPTIYSPTSEPYTCGTHACAQLEWVQLSGSGCKFRAAAFKACNTKTKTKLLLSVSERNSLPTRK